MLNEKEFNRVKEEVKLAYADCNGNKSYDETCNERNLKYFCETAVTPAEAEKIMKSALSDFVSDGYAYNEFRAKHLNNFPKEAKIHLARESSVCIYVEDNINIFMKSADEFHKNETKGNFDHLARYWWD